MSKIPVLLLLIFTVSMIPLASAQTSVSIILEKTTYSYCEKLFYTIKVSEVTGEPAIIHIRDEVGKGSSAIPIAITGLENPVPSLVAFQPEIFPTGKYFIDVQYMGQETTAEFELIDSGKKCIPSVIKQIATNWLSGNISDGFFVDALKKFVDSEIISVPFEINESNVYNIDIPEWVKFSTSWWMQDLISDDEFANIINYLINENIISVQPEISEEI